MKKFSFLALAAAGMLLGACSSDKDVADSAVTSLSGNEGFVGIAISLPSAENNTTRANDDLVNGKADEFEVKNAYLYLFKGTNESDATFMKRYTLSNAFANDQQGEQNTPNPQDGVTFAGGTGVTQTNVAVCKIDNPDLGDADLFAYVVVNAQGGLANEPAKGTTFTAFKTQELDADDRGGDLAGIIGDLGLLMTNSPISDKAAGSAAPTGEKITTLVKLKKTNIKTNEADARKSPAGCIYVERAAAKVTVENGVATADQKITMGSSELTYTIDGWQIINTEPKFYNARQVETTWDGLASDFCNLANSKYRFISFYAFNPQLPNTSTLASDAAPHTVGYRTYFAKDIQYGTEATLENTVAGGNLPGSSSPRPWNAISDRAFVPENTFDVDHQTWENTTMVTFRVKFGTGTDIYTLSDEANYFTVDQAALKVVERTQALYNVAAWMAKAAAKAANLLGISVKVRLVATLNTSTAGSNNLGYTISYQILNSSDVEQDLTPEQKSAIENEATAEGKKWADVKSEAESEIVVKKYAGGMAYYNARIQHFGEYETPWSATGTYITKPGSGTNGAYLISDIYGTDPDARTKNFLGRYGVVRDNWYHLTIDQIKKLGSAEPYDVKDDPTPDDEVEDEYYISAHVHILPWVLRKQSVKF